MLRQQAGNLPVAEILQRVQKLTGYDGFRLGIRLTYKLSKIAEATATSVPAKPTEQNRVV